MHFPYAVEVPDTSVKFLVLDTNELGISILDNARENWQGCVTALRYAA